MTNQPPNPDETPEDRPPQYPPPQYGPPQYGPPQYGPPGAGQPQYPGSAQYPGSPQYGQPYQGGYPPPGYPPPGYQAQPPRSPSNGAGIAALILGILGVLTLWTIIGGVVFGILAIILGVVGRSLFKKQQATNGGLSVAGIVLGVLALLGTIGFVVLGIGLFTMIGGRDFVDCVRDAGNDSAAVQRCEDEFKQSVENRFSITLTPSPSPAPR